MLMVRHLCFLACVVPAISLSHGDSASAARNWQRRGGACEGRSRGGLSLPRAVGAPTPLSQGCAVMDFNHPPGATPGQQLPHGCRSWPAGSRQGRALPHGLEHGPAGRPAQDRAAHSRMVSGTVQTGLGHARAARSHLRRGSRPSMQSPATVCRTGHFPAKPVSPACRRAAKPASYPMKWSIHVGAEVSPQALDAAARRLGLTPISSQSLALSGGRLVHFRIPSGQVADAVRMLEAEKIGMRSRTTYFQLQQDVHAAAPPPKGDRPNT